MAGGCLGSNPKAIGDPLRHQPVHRCPRILPNGTSLKGGAARGCQSTRETAPLRTKVYALAPCAADVRARGERRHVGWHKAKDNKQHFAN